MGHTYTARRVRAGQSEPCVTRFTLALRGVALCERAAPRVRSFMFRGGGA